MPVPLDGHAACGAEVAHAMAKGAAASMRKGAGSKGVKRAAAKPDTETKRSQLMASGQHTIHGTGCIGTKTTGAPCPLPRVDPHLPYCKECMRTGDPSLKVVKHPKFGKTLIAARNLRKGYIMAWWGRRVGRKWMPLKSWDWSLETRMGVIDAVPFRKGSLLQFSQCPGPSEKPTVDDAKQWDALLKQKPRTCLLFQTACDVPKSHQLTMMYNEDEKTTEEFFQERKIVRSDVGCAQYPALKKKKPRRNQRASSAMKK